MKIAGSPSTRRDCVQIMHTCGQPFTSAWKTIPMRRRRGCVTVGASLSDPNRSSSERTECVPYLPKTVMDFMHRGECLHVHWRFDHSA